MKELIRRAVRAVGYDITRWQPDRYERGFNSRHLATIAKPRTVFDVGVGNGSYPLYEAYPDAVFVLVEPVREYEPVVEQIRQKYDCRVVFKAVGAQEGQLEFTVDKTDPEKSSFETRSGLTSRAHQLEKRVVPVTTLDRILEENPDLPRPILLKIDTEGHEIEALRGAGKLLEVADMIIAEVSVAERFQGGYRFEDMILFMKERGWHVADILSIAHADGELTPRHMDVIFTRVSKHTSA